MLMKLMWVFNQNIVKKIIIILLAILIASITTSFGHADEGDVVVKQKKAEIENLKQIVLDLSALTDADTFDIQRKRQEVYGRLSVLKTYTFVGGKFSASADLSEILMTLSNASLTPDALRASDFNSRAIRVLAEVVTEKEKLEKEVGSSPSEKSEIAIPGCTECGKFSDLDALIKAFKKLFQENKSLKEEVKTLRADNKKQIAILEELNNKLSRLEIQNQANAMYRGKETGVLVSELQKAFQEIPKIQFAVEMAIKQRVDLDSKLSKFEGKEEAALSAAEKRELESLKEKKSELEKGMKELQAYAIQHDAKIKALQIELEGRQVDPRTVEPTRTPRGERLPHGRIQLPDGRIVNPDGTRVSHPDPDPRPEIPEQGMPVQQSLSQEDMVRQVILQNLNQINRGQRQGTQMGPQPRQTARGSRGITSGNGPRGNSVMDLVRYNR